MDNPLQQSETLIFVYGTLRKKYSDLFVRNQIPQRSIIRLLEENSAHIGEAVFQGKLFEVHGYPGAIKSANRQDRIIGDVFKIHSERFENVISRLDYYEECGSKFPQPTEYSRIKCTIIFNNQPLSAWVYLYNLPTAHLQQIESGDYLNYLKTINV